MPFDTPDLLKLLAGPYFLGSRGWQHRRRSVGEDGARCSQSGVLLPGVLFAQPTAAELGG
jgi:hypothetical protein